MLVSKLIETAIPYREKKALRAVLRRWGDIDCGRALHLLNTEPASVGQNAGDLGHLSVQRSKGDRSGYGRGSQADPATKQQTDTADESGALPASLRCCLRIRSGKRSSTTRPLRH